MQPANFNALFSQNIDVHSYNTRSKFDYRSNYGRSTFSRTNIVYTGPMLWNSLPAEFKESRTLNTFKRKFKDYLLKSL